MNGDRDRMGAAGTDDDVTTGAEWDEMVAALQERFLSPPAPEVERRHLDAMAAAHTRPGRRRIAVAAVAAVTIFSGATLAAAAGELPPPVQRRVAGLAAHLHLDLPTPSTTAPNGPPTSTPVGPRSSAGGRTERSPTDAPAPTSAHGPQDAPADAPPSADNAPSPPGQADKSAPTTTVADRSPGNGNAYGNGNGNAGGNNGNGNGNGPPASKPPHPTKPEKPATADG